jgi:hypothetical protein
MYNLTSFDELVISVMIDKVEEFEDIKAEDFDNIDLNEFIQEVFDDYVVYYSDAMEMFSQYYDSVISAYDDIMQELDYQCKIKDICNLVNTAMYGIAYKLICMLSSDLEIEEINEYNHKDIVNYLKNIKELLY